MQNIVGNKYYITFTHSFIVHNLYFSKLYSCIVSLGFSLIYIMAHL